jgi:hypothetical protein
VKCFQHLEALQFGQKVYSSVNSYSSDILEKKKVGHLVKKFSDFE